MGKIKQLNNPKHSNNRVYGNDGDSPSLNQMQGGNRQPKVKISEQSKSIRRLTPVECARLQGFPDNWHEGISETQAYKCYGNAVSVPVVKMIAERLLRNYGDK